MAAIGPRSPKGSAASTEPEGADIEHLREVAAEAYLSKEGVAIAVAVGRLNDRLTELFKNGAKAQAKVEKERQVLLDRNKNELVTLLLDLGDFLLEALPMQLQAHMALYRHIRALQDEFLGIPSDELAASPRPIASRASGRVQGAANPSFWWQQTMVVCACLEALYQSRPFLNQLTAKPTLAAAADYVARKYPRLELLRRGRGKGDIEAHFAGTILWWRKQVCKPAKRGHVPQKAYEFYWTFRREVIDGIPAAQKAAAADTNLRRIEDQLLPS